MPEETLVGLRNKVQAMTTYLDQRSGEIDLDAGLSPVGKAERKEKLLASYQADIAAPMTEARRVLEVHRGRLDRALAKADRDEVAAARDLLGDAGAMEWYKARLRRLGPRGIVDRYHALGADDAWERAVLEAAGGAIIAEHGDDRAKVLRGQLDDDIGRRSRAAKIGGELARVGSLEREVETWDAVSYRRELASRFKL